MLTATPRIRSSSNKTVPFLREYIYHLASAVIAIAWQILTSVGIGAAKQLLTDLLKRLTKHVASGRAPSSHPDYQRILALQAGLLANPNGAAKLVRPTKEHVDRALRMLPGLTRSSRGHVVVKAKPRAPPSAQPPPSSSRAGPPGGILAPRKPVPKFKIPRGPPRSHDVISAPASVAWVQHNSGARMRSWSTDEGFFLEIEHEEYYLDMLPSTNYAVQSIQINPGLVSAFDWLPNIAQNYSQYKWTDFEVFLLTEQPTSSQGAEFVTASPNPNQAPPASKAEFMAQAFATRTVPWLNTSYKVDRAILDRVVGQAPYFVRSGPAPTTDDSNYDNFILFVGTQGTGSDTGVLAEIHFKYRCLFKNPVYTIANEAPGVIGVISSGDGSTNIKNSWMLPNGTAGGPPNSRRLGVPAVLGYSATGGAPPPADPGYATSAWSYTQTGNKLIATCQRAGIYAFDCNFEGTSLSLVSTYVAVGGLTMPTDGPVYNTAVTHGFVHLNNFRTPVDHTWLKSLVGDTWTLDTTGAATVTYANVAIYEPMSVPAKPADRKLQWLKLPPPQPGFLDQPALIDHDELSWALLTRDTTPPTRTVQIAGRSVQVASAVPMSGSRLRPPASH